MAELNNTGTGQWAEVDASNDSPPPDGWPPGMEPSAVEPAARSNMGALKRFWDRINGTVATTGSAGAYIYTPANTAFPTAYVTGERYSWRANFTSVGGDTLDINGLGAKPLYRAGNSGPTPIGAGDIQSGQAVSTMYDAALGSAGGLHVIGGVAAAVPSGMVGPFAGSTTPAGWLLCDGSAVSRSGYANLYAAIGTTWGAGDGSTTFNVPDLRGRGVAGNDSATGRLNPSGQFTNAALGAVGGEAAHTLSQTEMPAHSHGVNDPTHSHTLAGGGNQGVNGSTGVPGSGNSSPPWGTGDSATGISIQNTGGGGAHNNVQPTVIMNYIIKT